MANEVIVYTTNDCVECTFVKKVLTENGIPFDVRNIAENEVYQKEVERYGFLGVPVTVVGDRAVKGFTPELIELLEPLKQD
ncbi:glutaredoxin family protein [Bacillus timonensis]|uniref:Glutaredoxin family protein n=1 Tax=Bacillus timonensis TaxID=1033734 RepID=A0A4S3PMI6_9BACI|nr:MULTISPECIES: glutaredoxin family protein [Bacillus]RFB13509.1 glutaredoxin family protein [Bacillus sp. HNG]THE10751.1 glutaredoxin family protein [Bacillus timonensis]